LQFLRIVKTQNKRCPRASILLFAATAALAACGRTSSDNQLAASAEANEEQAAPPTATGGKGKRAEGPSRGGVPTSELVYTEMKVTVDEITGDPKEDNFRFINVFGELKNGSSQWVQQIVGDIIYYDAAGKMLGIDSISTGVKQDVGDDSPGERFSSEIEFIAPGASAPVHHIRALGKLAGKYASHKVVLRPARAVSKHPEGVLEGMSDVVAVVPNETLNSPTPHEHRVISGTIRNKGSMGCRKPGLVVGYYDPSGKLAALSEYDSPGEISQVVAPGATVPVKVFTLVGFEDAWKAKAQIKTWVSCSEPYS
jgi:hypothetical protein